MSQLWGVAIPGLAMHNSEIPAIPGLLVLQNPEVDDGVILDSKYSLYDVAEIHLKKINAILSGHTTNQEEFWIIGMSMGGMVNSILASELRSKLPAKVKFGFLVTTANLSTNQAVPDSLLSDWSKAKPGCTEDFKTILSPFFSDTFIQKSETVTNQYYEYRANGKNRQSPKAFYRQLTALRQFEGAKYFSKINPSECTFVGGAKDYILGPKHNLDLKSLSPESTHIEISDLGHMINIEKPDLFNLKGGINV